MNLFIQFTPEKNIRLFCQNNPPEYFIIPSGFPVCAREESVALRLSSRQEATLYAIALRVGKMAFSQCIDVNLIFQGGPILARGGWPLVQADDVIIAYDRWAQEVGSEEAAVAVASDLAGDGFLGIIRAKPTVLHDVPVAVREQA